jgi:oligoribonuclease NrnB/cAMP/cGMP phosphodiesterase (DHH superfamily)
MEKYNVIIYHKDNDGRCAAAVAYRALRIAQDLDIMLFEMDYDKAFPQLPENIEKLYLLDFSFGKNTMKKFVDLVGFDKIVWLDHHISAINQLKEYEKLEGRRTEKWSGAMLTWKWFNPDEKIPYVVELVDAYDRWQMKYGDDTLNFYEYSLGLDLDDIAGKTWSELLWLNKDVLKIKIENGDELRKRRHEELRKLAKEIGVPMKIQWKGKEYTCLKINENNHINTSLLGEIIYNEMGYDIAHMWYVKKSPKTGKLIKVNHMRSVTVDVSRIAAKMGGGGHPNACGWNEDFRE